MNKLCYGLLLIGSLFMTAPSSFAGEIPAWQNYIPGKSIDLEEFYKASCALDRTQDKKFGVVAAYETLIRVTEPEALLALHHVLQHQETRVFYGSFTALDPGSFDDEIHLDHLDDNPKSIDSLLGLRLIWQREIPKGDGLRLVSAITTHYYDPQDRDENGLPRLTWRIAPGAMRIRVEVIPFRKRRQTNSYAFGTGMIGFSWFTKLSPDDRSLALEAKSFMHDDGYLKYPNTSPCDFISHCRQCHHGDARNHFAAEYASTVFKANDGIGDFIEQITDEMDLANSQRELLAEKLRFPRKAFSPEQVIKAIEQRWQKITKKNNQLSHHYGRADQEEQYRKKSLVSPSQLQD